MIRKNSTSTDRNLHQDVNNSKKPARLEALNVMRSIGSLDKLNLTDLEKAGLMKRDSDYQRKDLKHESSSSITESLRVDSSIEDFKSAKSEFFNPAFRMDVIPHSKDKTVINEFDELCNELLSCLGELESSLEEMTLWKDDFLRQSAPSNVKLQMTTMFSKLFRSKSDFHEPLFELIKQVRTYSRPWVSKKICFLEIEEDYVKQTHILDVAIRKLEHLQVSLNKMKSDSRISYWERVSRRLILKSIKEGEYIKPLEEESIDDPIAAAFGIALPEVLAKPETLNQEEEEIDCEKTLSNLQSAKSSSNSAERHNNKTHENSEYQTSMKDDIMYYISSGVPMWKQNAKEMVRQFNRILRMHYPNLGTIIQSIHIRQLNPQKSNIIYPSVINGSFIQGQKKTRNHSSNFRKSWSNPDLHRFNATTAAVAEVGASGEVVGRGGDFGVLKNKTQLLIRSNSFNAAFDLKTMRLKRGMGSRENEVVSERSRYQVHSAAISTENSGSEFEDDYDGYDDDESDSSSQSAGSVNDIVDYGELLSENDQISLHNTIARFFGADDQYLKEQTPAEGSEAVQNAGSSLNMSPKTQEKRSPTSFSVQEVMEITLLHAEQMQMMNDMFEKRIAEMEITAKEEIEDHRVAQDQLNEKLKIANGRIILLANEIKDSSHHDLKQTRIEIPNAHISVKIDDDDESIPDRPKKIKSNYGHQFKSARHAKKKKDKGPKYVHKRNQNKGRQLQPRKKPVFQGQQFQMSFLERLKWFTKANLENKNTLTKITIEEQKHFNERRLIESGHLVESTQKTDERLLAEFMPNPGKINRANSQRDYSFVPWGGKFHTKSYTGTTKPMPEVNILNLFEVASNLNNRNNSK